MHIPVSPRPGYIDLHQPRSYFEVTFSAFGVGAVLHRAEVEVRLHSFPLHIVQVVGLHVCTGVFDLLAALASGIPAHLCDFSIFKGNCQVQDIEDSLLSVLVFAQIRL